MSVIFSKMGEDFNCFLHTAYSTLETSLRFYGYVSNFNSSINSSKDDVLKLFDVNKIPEFMNDIYLTGDCEDAIILFNMTSGNFVFDKSLSKSRIYDFLDKHHGDTQFTLLINNAFPHLMRVRTDFNILDIIVIMDKYISRRRNTYIFNMTNVLACRDDITLELIHQYLQNPEYNKIVFAKKFLYELKELKIDLQRAQLNLLKEQHKLTTKRIKETFGTFNNSNLCTQHRKSHSSLSPLLRTQLKGEVKALYDRAIESDPMMLEFYPTKELTCDKIKSCIERKPISIQFVHMSWLRKYPDLTELAFTKDTNTFPYIRNWLHTEDMIDCAIAYNGLFLEYVDKSKRTLERCKIAVEQNPAAIQFI